MRAPRVKDWLKWVAAGFALVATASAEYELARAIGMNEFIAAAVPGALDAYVVRALRAHREVLTSVLAMVGVNAASHLVTAGIMPVDWRLITAVSAIAPLVLWRVHALSTPGEARARVLWTGRLRACTPVTPDEHASTQPQTCEHGCEVWGDLGAHERAHVLAGWDDPEHDVNVGPVTSEWDEHMKDVPGLGDYVPAEWSERARTEQEQIKRQTRAWEGDWVNPASTPPLPVRVPGSTVTDTSEHGPECPCTACSGVPAWVKPPLQLVPPLPAGFEHAELNDGDACFMGQARALVSVLGEVPTVRALKSELGVGTPRAQRVHAALVKEASTDADRS